MPSGLADLLALQCGVVSRRQALAAGLGEADVRRLLRRREWTTVHAGVYVDHTGPLLWQQRAWAAVLALWPAALCHDSALRAVDGPGRRDRDEHGPVHVAVDRNRAVQAPAGVVVHRLGAFAAKVWWNASPPRVRVEHAVLDLAAESGDELAAVATLADAVQSRRTTAPRILTALDGRTRIAHRGFLEQVLQDISEGTCSALEHAFLTRVERPHRLPARPGSTDRQAAPSGGIWTTRPTAWSSSWTAGCSTTTRGLVTPTWSVTSMLASTTPGRRSGWVGARCCAGTARPRTSWACC